MALQLSDIPGNKPPADRLAKGIFALTMLAGAGCLGGTVLNAGRFVHDVNHHQNTEKDVTQTILGIGISVLMFKAAYRLGKPVR